MDEYSTFYRNGLCEQVLPFWLNHGLDRKNGGVYTCLDRDGSLIDTDKSVWAQGRFVWLLSTLYTTLDANDEWLAAAKNVVEFVQKHCIDRDGRCFFQVTEEGRPVRKRRYLFSEAFVSAGLGMYGATAGDDACVERALGLYRLLLDYYTAPGHIIEAGWFILYESYRRGGDSELTALACEIIDWAWNCGWDGEYGGIIYYRDVSGLPSTEYAHDMKFWWPQCETIIANLLAAKMTGRRKYYDRHRMIHDWTYERFPDAEHGEWFGYLHRDGRLSTRLKGNIWKGPFHIPRMQWFCHSLLEERLR